MPTLKVDLSISKDEMLRWYTGGAKYVKTYSIDGRSVRFPVELIRPYVTHSGVVGQFEIEFAETGQFQQIRRL